MKRKPAEPNHVRTPDQIERDREIRLKYQSSRPSLASLEKSGDYSAAIRQGDYLAMMELAARMKARRVALGLSLDELSLRTGIDQGAICRLENGQAENPTYNTLARIAKALKQRLKLVLCQILIFG